VNIRFFRSRTSGEPDSACFNFRCAWPNSSPGCASQWHWFGLDADGKIETVGYNESDTSMIPRQIGGELAVLVAFCIVAIFFFPAMQGPYSAVNGPAERNR